MSYVPYHPDVWPAEPVEDLRPRLRVLRWACAAMLYLLGIVAWVVWMKMPPRIQPPIAAIHLSDGTELRLVHYNVGSTLDIRSGDTFGNRIRRENTQPMDASLHDPQGGVWMVFTDFDPRLKTFQKPNINSFDIREPGSPYTLRPSRIAPGNGPYTVLLFPAIPWGSSASELDVEVVHEGQATTAKIPNPVAGWIPAARPQAPANPVKSTGVVSLPHQLEHSGFTVVAEKVTFKKAAPSSGSSGSHDAEARVRVTHPVARPSDYNTRIEWFDERGNLVKQGVLPWSEPVWGLRVTVQEGTTFPIPPERFTELGTFKAPAAGQAIKLTVPPQMKRDGVSDILLIGAGSYSWSGNKLLAMSGGGTAGKAVATASGVTRGGSLNEPAWGLYILGMGRAGEPEKRANLRIRKGDAFCVHGSSGSSTWGSYRQQHFGSYRLQKGGQVPAGEEISVEVFAPETHRFEFLLSRPEFVPSSPK